MDMLSGKKTYVIAGVGLVVSALKGFGFDIPGMGGDTGWLTSALTSLAMMALRHGISKSR